MRSWILIENTLFLSEVPIYISKIVFSLFFGLILSVTKEFIIAYIINIIIIHSLIIFDIINFIKI